MNILTYLPVLLFYETADSRNLVLFNDFCCLLCVAGGRKIYFHELPMRYYAFYFLFRNQIAGSQSCILFKREQYLKSNASLFDKKPDQEHFVNKYLVVNVGKEILSHHFYKHIPHCHPFIFSIPGNKILCRNQKNIRMTGFRKISLFKITLWLEKTGFPSRRYLA